MPDLRKPSNVCIVLLTITINLCVANTGWAQQESALLKVFSNTTAATVGEFQFSGTTDLSLSGSNWGFGVNENDVYHAALTHTQTGGVANREWELRIGKGGQIYSIRSEVGEIVPPQSFARPYNDEVFQAISVDTSPRDSGGQAVFYHQSGYYVDNGDVPQPTFAPLLASGSAESNSWSTLSLAVQADAQSNPQRPSSLLNYQRTRDLGDGVIEITHMIYNFGTVRVNFHNLPWGGVRKTVFDHMLVSNPNGGFTNRQIDDFDITANQVVTADTTGGWAAFAEGTADADRGLAYVFGATDTHLSEPWQAFKSSWRWGDGGGDFLGLPIRNFNVGTFRREVDIDPGDLFESRYFLVLGDVYHIESCITSRNLASKANYGKRTITEEDSHLLAWQILDDGGALSIVGSAIDQPSDFMTYALPVNGSQPLFLFEDDNGTEFVSVDPYALSNTPYDGVTRYKGILGFVLPTEIASDGGNYIDLQSVFEGQNNYLDTNSGTTFLVVPGVSEPTSEILLGDVNRDGAVDFSAIQTFIAVLTNGSYQTEADVNQDGITDFMDIAPFIAILSGGQGN
jgi:hypothetical protein